MAADQEGSRQRTTDPIVAGIGEAVSHGYRAVDHVYAGLAQSARLMQASGSARAVAATRRRTPAVEAEEAGMQPTTLGERAGTRRRTSTPSPTIVGELAGLTADMLDRLGEAARDIAGRIGESPVAEQEPEVGRLRLRAHADRTGATEFRFTNTGSTTLQGVECEATPLLGVAGAIDVTFVYDEPEDARLRPRASTSVGIEVTVPAEAPPGTYRGVVVARAVAPGGSGAAEGQRVAAWALLELEVLASDPRR